MFYMKWSSLAAKTEKVFVYEEKKFGRIDSRIDLHESKNSHLNVMEIFGLAEKSVELNSIRSRLHFLNLTLSSTLSTEIVGNYSPL
jgi:hypothetical protein